MALRAVTLPARATPVAGRELIPFLFTLLHFRAGPRGLGITSGPARRAVLVLCSVAVLPLAASGFGSLHDGPHEGGRAGGSCRVGRGHGHGVGPERGAGAGD